jgi:hypothetical protein
VAPLFEATPDKFKTFQPAEQIHPDTARKPDFFYACGRSGKNHCKSENHVKNHVKLKILKK